MRVLGASLVALLVAVVATTGAASAQPGIEFKMGFKALADLIPDVVGRPLAKEQHNPENGDALQPTTTGMMVWRKADNWTAFTDGATTWVNGPYGVQERPNGDRFKWEGLPDLVPSASPGDEIGVPGAVLSQDLLVAWYGTPWTPLMGILGRYTGAELAEGLQRQADAYASLTNKKIVPCYELIGVVAMGSPSDNGLWRRREAPEVIDSMLAQARVHGFRLILDVQMGRSRVEDELEYLRPYLEQPDVYLALDPEFDMEVGQEPGEELGHTVSGEVNYALGLLEKIVLDKGLPPKVLIVHQFRLSMLPDKEKIGRSPVVDLVLDADGFGSQAVKRDTYRAVMETPLQFAGIKMFYNHDPDLFTPAQVMALDPAPSVVVYQ
jgi:hypothetical protein